MKTKEFVEYVFQFYGKEVGLYKDAFAGGVTKQEIQEAVQIRKGNKDLDFVGDSFDREIVRDIMLMRRELKRKEYDMTPYMKGIVS